MFAAGGILASVLSWFFGGGLTKIGQLGLDFYKQKLTAENSTEAQVVTLAKRAADLDQREAELDNRLLVAEQGNWATRWVRPAWAAPCVIWTWKVLVWDACLGWGSMPDLHGTPATLMSIISVSYFGSRGLEKLVDKWATVRMTVTGKK